jgi:UDP-glucose 4-epimerase
MVGFGRMFVSMIYVGDLVGVILKILADDRFDGRIYFTSDGKPYSFSEVVAVIARLLNRRRFLRIPIPSRIALLYGALNDALVPEKKRVINRDRIRVMTHPYWLCSNERMSREIGYKPAYDLDRGLAETIGWYRAQGLIR